MENQSNTNQQQSMSYRIKVYTLLDGIQEGRVLILKNMVKPENMQQFIEIAWEYMCMFPLSRGFEFNDDLTTLTRYRVF